MSKMQSFIHSCLVDAASAIAKARDAGLSIRHKERNNLATSADLASEKLIVSRIRKDYPDSTVLSEESYSTNDLLADSLFVIDPIDGTHNFVQNLPLYGVSIAHFSKGKPTAGGLYFIPQKTFFYAEKGKAATMDGRRISASKTGKLEDFFLLCDTRIHTIAKQGFLPGLVRLEEMSQHTRFLGAAIYDMGYVACGMADASLHFKLKPYDFAACAFIAEQAGGTVTDLEGKKWALESKRFLCSNGRQHKRMLGILSGRQ